MSQTEQILDRFRESQGWSDATILDLALTYIENQANPEGWEDYLNSLKEVDDDIDAKRDVRGCSCGMADYGAPGHEHDARPDDDPEPGDRCKDCGKDITWIGPSQYDWEHVS